MTEQHSSRGFGSIVVGAPLPFSVYSNDRKLLLAEGQVVESDRVRDMLLRNGRRQDGEPLSRHSVDDSVRNESQDQFAAYVHDFNLASGQARIGARLSREDSGENYPCWVLGADDVHGLIVTAPSRPDRSLLPIAEGQTWVFRLLYLTAACKFSGTICKVQFEPTPLLHVSPPKQVEMRLIRSSPRVVACMRGTIDAGKEIPVMITDIGVGGACIAVERTQIELRPGLQMKLIFSIAMLGINYNFKVPAIVTNIRNELEKRYPALQFAGVKIESHSELERLVLHGYVFERAAMNFNALWQVLMSHKM